MFKTGAVIKGFVASKWGKVLMVGSLAVMGAKTALDYNGNEGTDGLTYELVQQTPEEVAIEGAQEPTSDIKLPFTSGSADKKEIKIVEAKETENTTEAESAAQVERATETEVVETTQERSEIAEEVVETVEPAQQAPVQTNNNVAAQAKVEAERQAAQEATRIQAEAEQAARDAQAEAERLAQIAAEEAERQRQQAEEAARLQPGSIYMNGSKVNGYEQSSNVFVGFDGSIIGSTVTIANGNGNGRDVFVSSTPVYVANINGTYIDVDTQGNANGLASGSFGTVFLTSGVHPTYGIECIIIYTAY